MSSRIASSSMARFSISPVGHVSEGRNVSDRDRVLPSFELLCRAGIHGNEEPLPTAPGSASHCWPSRGVHRRRSVVVTAAADGVSHPSHHQQDQADNEEDDAGDQNKMGEGEGRDEAREE
jgi:hypothetical protein